jgi:Aldo/keto reductase family
MNITMTRREFTALAGAVVLSSPASAQTGELIARVIPGSGERLPAVGLGTAYVFDRNDETTRQKAAAVVQALVAGGGSLIDTSSAYGDAEAVLGEVIAAAALRDKLFIATKLESPDAVELKRSRTRLRRRSSTCCNSITSAIRSNRWRSSENGKSKAFAVTSASPRPGTGIFPPSKR